LHYTAILLLSAELVCYFLFRLGERGWAAYRPRAVALDLAATFLICAPALRHLEDIAARRDNWAHFVDKSPLSTILTFYPLDIYVGLPLAIVGFVVALRWYRERRPWIQSMNGRAVLLTLCWLFVPLLIAWALTQTDQARLFFPRYVIATAAAPIALVTSLCPTHTTRVVSAAAVLAVAIVNIGPLPQWFQDGRVVQHSEEDWRAAVMAANNAPRRKLPLFVYSGLIEADGLRDDPPPLLEEFCLLPIAGPYRFDRTGRRVVPLPFSRAWSLTADQWQLILESRGALFLIRGPEDFVGSFLDQLVGGVPDSSAKVTVASQQSFGHLALVRIVVDHVQWGL
jgi:hypothetical protein